MNCEYIQQYYGVPARIGLAVKYNGDAGVIAQDGGNYVAVNFDKDKPGHIGNIHPTDEGLKYLDFEKKIRPMTRSQQRYKRFLEWGDGFHSFIDFCYWDADKSHTWNR